jgi:hypothetical protein
VAPDRWSARQRRAAALDQVRAAAAQQQARAGLVQFFVVVFQSK